MPLERSIQLWTSLGVEPCVETCTCNDPEHRAPRFVVGGEVRVDQRRWTTQGQAHIEREGWPRIRPAGADRQADTAVQEDIAKGILVGHAIERPGIRSTVSLATLKERRSSCLALSH